ncbi:MAG: serine/threonine protein kinase, partial [Deltaproteobacteria bacterium]|nr:serine/threonine protein kinase [Deltaproteobacteria bacterium]
MFKNICPQCNLETENQICPNCSSVTTIVIESAIKSDKFTGRIINGKYRIDEFIGKGGMGTVFRATNLVINQKVAIKIMQKELVESDEQVKRFINEARVTAQLEHPNTLKVYDFGETEDGLLYIVMEYLKGKTLAKVVTEEGALSQERVIDIVISIARSLSEAHEKGLVHRDLKSENIMLLDFKGQKDFVKVLDFGIAKIVAGDKNEPSLTKKGMTVGSPSFMSPEQVLGNSLDGRSDLYSLGIIMYQTLSGKLPFTGENPVSILLAHLNNDAPDFPAGVRINKRLKEIVFSMLSKDAEARPGSADALIEMLEKVKQELSLPEKKEKAAVREKKHQEQAVEKKEEKEVAGKKGFSRRKFFLFAACALLLAVTGAYFSGVYSIIFGGKKQPVVLVNP